MKQNESNEKVGKLNKFAFKIYQRICVVNRIMVRLSRKNFNMYILKKFNNINISYQMRVKGNCKISAIISNYDVAFPYKSSSTVNIFYKDSTDL